MSNVTFSPALQAPISLSNPAGSLDLVSIPVGGVSNSPITTQQGGVRLLSDALAMTLAMKAVAGQIAAAGIVAVVVSGIVTPITPNVGSNGYTGVSPNVAVSTPVSGGLPDGPLTFISAQGGDQIGNFTGSAWQQLMARYNFIEYTWYGGLESGMISRNGTTLRQSMRNVKNAAAALGNPYCKTGFYYIVEEMYAVNETRKLLFSITNQMNWWLRSGSWPGGAIVVDGTYNANTVNQSTSTNNSNVAGFSSGLSSHDTAIEYMYQCAIAGNAAGIGENSFTSQANPEVDFMLADNQWCVSRYAGDYLQNGTSQPSGEGIFPTVSPVTTLIQQGYAKQLARWRSRAPNLMLAGNTDNMAYHNAPFDPSCNGKRNIPYCEAVFGNAFPVYSYCGSFQELINRMVAHEVLVMQPGRSVINMESGPCPGASFPTLQSNWNQSFTGGKDPNGNSIQTTGWTANYWQAARFAAATALLRNWMCEVSAAVSNQFYYLDEWNKSGAQFNWLGAPIGALQTGPWQNGVWRQDYVNGIVLCNPVNNGQQTVTITARKLSNNGFSDPTVNNGAVVTSVILQNGDGLVLLRS